MPASNMSTISNMSQTVVNDKLVAFALKYAKDFAQREINFKIQSRELDPYNRNEIERVYKHIKNSAYYKAISDYAHLFQQPDSLTPIVKEHKRHNRYYNKHTVFKFTKLNFLVHAQVNFITVGRLEVPMNEASLLPETKDSFLTVWPGPLDRLHDQLKHNIASVSVTSYIDKLAKYDSQRCFRYNQDKSDKQRITILKLLKKLLRENGKIDAPGVTGLLLENQQHEIDEKKDKPLVVLQKKMLVGMRVEAIEYACKNKLWDHAQCLAFLHKYQPQNRIYSSDTTNMKQDSIVRLIEEYISCLECKNLQIVYMSLLNRVYQNSTVDIVTKPRKVGDDAYEFAMLSANDCEMEYEPTNEVFKLIVAVKNAMKNTKSAYDHLISLGFTYIDRPSDPSDDISNRSHLSFPQVENHITKTLTISSLDATILNEIWEYCLNLASDSADPTNYRHIINLIPYKIVFASKLIDFGLHRQFMQYLISIKSALDKTAQDTSVVADPAYDWDTINMSVNMMVEYWKHFSQSKEFTQHGFGPEDIIEDYGNFYPKNQYEAYSQPPVVAQPWIQPQQQPQPQLPPQPQFQQQPQSQQLHNPQYTSHPMTEAEPPRNQPQQEQPHFEQQYQPMSQVPPPSSVPLTQYDDHYNQQPYYMDGPNNDFNMPSNDSQSPQEERHTTDYEENESRRQSMDVPSPGQWPLSPINSYDQVDHRPSSDFVGYQYNSTMNNDTDVLPPPTLPPPPQNKLNSSSNMNSNSTSNANSSNQPNKSQAAGDQSKGPWSYINKLIPRSSSSKEMKLPDDTNTNIDADGRWIGNQADGADDLAAPPVAPSMAPMNYKFASKMNKPSDRYPKPVP